jgi:hypothetical protein
MGVDESGDEGTAVAVQPVDTGKLSVAGRKLVG